MRWYVSSILSHQRNHYVVLCAVPSASYHVMPAVFNQDQRLDRWTRLSSQNNPLQSKFNHSATHSINILLPQTLLVNITFAHIILLQHICSRKVEEMERFLLWAIALANGFRAFSTILWVDELKCILFSHLHQYLHTYRYKFSWAPL